MLVILGVALAVIGIRRALKPMAIVIDHDGIVPDSRYPAQRVPWSDLRGAHFAVVEGPSNGSYFASRPRFAIVALELVDPAAFYRRWDAAKRPWLGYDTGMRPDYFPIYCEALGGAERNRLMYAISHGITRYGKPAPDANPRTVYDLFFS
ncbi:MAG TPA: hypothetical protein VFF19_03850 [Reyranella sp.]|nr:hypothetical protein [Reyranella sp.]